MKPLFSTGFSSTTAHFFATLLLNAGASVLTVQALLGHKHVDTTLRYARVYDQTVAADYVRAVCETERRLELPEATVSLPSSDGQRQDRRSAVASPGCTNPVGANLYGQMLFICNGLPSRYT